MGGGEAEGAWAELLRAFLKRLEARLGPVEGLILFGSAASGQAGEWSDLDVLVVSDALRGLPVPERIELLLEEAGPRMEPLGYTYEELASMLRRANPLALAALVEGVFIKASARLRELASEASRSFVRKGRVWIPRGQLGVGEPRPPRRPKGH